MYFLRRKTKLSLNEIICKYDINQTKYSIKIKEIIKHKFGEKIPKAFVKTYGCQQNVSDSEKYKGMLSQMGFSFTDSQNDADVILFNTCAIRENAENKALGNLGWIKNIKKSKPDLFVIICGCMTEQEIILEKIKAVYPFVNLVIGTHSAHKFPEFFYKAYQKIHKKIYISEKADVVPEELPIKRDSKLKAFVSVMYGCDNFCSYCIVPYVRGRERSRKPENIIEEFRCLVNSGYKDITLLGQNVNSYGKGLEEKINFPELLRRIDSIDGDYKIRFMTSHPKDATHELFDVISESRHIAHHIHLPVQCGNDRILKLMNRKYDIKTYLEKINYAKSKIPDLTLTSDIIVGFPGETYEEFKDTLELIKKVKFSSLFTFIYSPRSGTPAAKIPDPTGKPEKTKRILELLKTQEEISKNLCSKMVGKKMRVLAESLEPKSGYIMCRTDGNITVQIPNHKEIIGNFVDVMITGSRSESLIGKLI